MIFLFCVNSSKSLYALILEKRVIFLDWDLFSVLIQDLFSFCKSGSTVVSIIYLPVSEREGALF